MREHLQWLWLLALTIIVVGIGARTVKDMHRIDDHEQRIETTTRWTVDTGMAMENEVGVDLDWIVEGPTIEINVGEGTVKVDGVETPIEPAPPLLDPDGNPWTPPEDECEDPSVDARPWWDRYMPQPYHPPSKEYAS